MRWSERQVAMLREMGIRLWPTGPAVTATESAVQISASAPASDTTPAPANSASGPTVAAAPAMARATPSTPTVARGAQDAAPARVVPPGSRPAGIDAMGWEELRAAAAGCTACKLCQGRKQAVFGTGSTRAQWLIVGEAPGEQEDLQGEPFVGKSGQLLDAMLRAIGLTRGEAEPPHQVYIANTIKCRPPGNRNPQPDELAQCEPFLMRQLALLKPRIIVAMGRFAVQSLLRSDEPVGKLRGRVHRYQGVPLIVTYHPAYLLRNPEDKARAWDDLCLAVETAALAAAD
jgi:uracil-DNA glycosylase